MHKKIKLPHKEQYIGIAFTFIHPILITDLSDILYACSPHIQIQKKQTCVHLNYVSNHVLTELCMSVRDIGKMLKKIKRLM